jgi:hypothetical protein
MYPRSKTPWPKKGLGSASIRMSGWDLRKFLRGWFRFDRLKSGGETPIIVSRRLLSLHAIQ